MTTQQRPEPRPLAPAGEAADATAARRRLAAQIVLDLKDKLGPVTAEAGADGEVLAWLTAMGFPAAEAQAAVAKLPRDPAPPMEERVRQALTILRPE